MKSMWNQVKLKDVCENVQYGYTESATDKVVGPKFLRITDIVKETINWDSVPYCPISTSNHEKYKLRRGDIVVARTGNTTGWAKLIRSEIDSVFASYLIRFQINREVADSGYIGRLIESAIFKDYVWSVIGGAAQPGANAQLLSSFQLMLPPLPTQQKIAQTLSAYDDLIENNLKRIKLLEEMAQITYEQWFVHMKFPGHETTPIDAETGLPEGWTEAGISTLCHINFDSITKNTAPESIRYIDIASAYTGGYNAPLELPFSEAPGRARRRVKYGDTIFSTVRPNRKTYSMILERDPLLVVSTGFATLTPKISGTHPFIYLSVANQTFVDKAVAVAGGAAYPAVNQSDFKKIEIVIPEKKVIRKFSEITSGSFELIGNLANQNQHLKEARDILLPRLMTGMIDVGHIELPTSQPNSEAA